MTTEERLVLVKVHDGDGGGPSGRDRSDSYFSHESEDDKSYRGDDGALASDSALAVSPGGMTEAQRNSSVKSAPFYKIVLTGGPCGGKTTALARLSSYLRERGFEVITSPEAFSILISNGMSMEYFSVEGMDATVQSTVLDLQISLEDGFERLLRARGKPSVLLCDRGLMDGAAYMSPEDWDGLLRERGVRASCDLREGRYNAVFHMVTAAEGAERYYTLENNEVRTESPEEARRLDKLTRGAWVGHPRLCVLDNSTDFEGKLQRLVDATAKLVGLPSRLSRVSAKFLLRSRPKLEDFPPDVKYHVFEVEKLYLYDDVSPEEKKDSGSGSGSASENDPDYDEEYSFVRRRTHLSPSGRKLGSAYGQTTVRRTRDGQVIEVKRILTRREFAAARKMRDPHRHVVRQKRVSFLYGMQSFNVHMYESPVEGLCVLHAQVEAHSPKCGDGGDGGAGGDGAPSSPPDVNLPPFLDVERRLENTREDEERYGAFNISLKK